jgi:hypothetical protein
MSRSKKLIWTSLILSRSLRLDIEATGSSIEWLDRIMEEYARWKYCR